MNQKSMDSRERAEHRVRDIRRKTRKQYSAEEKIRIVLSGLRSEDSISELYRREGIAEILYYSWSKEFLEACKKQLSGDFEAIEIDEIYVYNRPNSSLKAGYF